MRSTKANLGARGSKLGMTCMACFVGGCFLEDRTGFGVLFSIVLGIHLRGTSGFRSTSSGSSSGPLLVLASSTLECTTLT
jgi:hypothetical protein